MHWAIYSLIIAIAATFSIYLTKSLMHGDHEASLLYGAYCSLVYAAPVLGGRMADL